MYKNNLLIYYIDQKLKFYIIEYILKKCYVYYILYYILLYVIFIIFYYILYYINTIFTIIKSIKTKKLHIYIYITINFFLKVD